MATEKTLVAIEIRKTPDISPQDLEKKNPQELMVASLANGVAIERCGGVLLGRNATQPVDLINCKEPRHFIDILEQGQFCLEIPSESMTSAVITEKILKTPPQERARMLAKMMHEHHVPQVILLAPHHICA